MEYRVGDKVKIINLFQKDNKYINKIGEIVNIREKIFYLRPYLVEFEDGNVLDFCGNELELIEMEDYTFEDLKKCPIGTKITFENGKIFLKYDNKENDYVWISNNNEIRTNNTLEGFKDNFSDLSKIIKIEEPVYKEVNFKAKEDILNKKEKEYLNNIIKPFKNKVIEIKKTQAVKNNNYYFITIFVKAENGLEYISLPYFKNNMYKNMKIEKDYTLKELELED